MYNKNIMTKATNDNKALLVLDMQEVCVGKNPAKIFKYDKTLIDKVNETIVSNDTVIYIRTLLKDNPFYKLSPIRVFDGTKQAELAENLTRKQNNIFNKYRGNAFSNPELFKYLQAHNIDTIEIVGVDGAGCVSKTALGALKHHLKVIINTTAVGTMFKNRQKRLFKLLAKKGVTFID